MKDSSDEAQVQNELNAFTQKLAHPWQFRSKDNAVEANAKLGAELTKVSDRYKMPLIGELTKAVAASFGQNPPALADDHRRLSDEEEKQSQRQLQTSVGSYHQELTLHSENHRRLLERVGRLVSPTFLTVIAILSILDTIWHRVINEEWRVGMLTTALLSTAIFGTVAAGTGRITIRQFAKVFGKRVKKRRRLLLTSRYRPRTNVVPSDPSRESHAALLLEHLDEVIHRSEQKYISYRS